MDKEIEVMRIIRIPPLGKLVIQVNDTRYDTLDQIPDERLKRRLITSIGELIGFAGGYQTLVDQGIAPPIGPQMPSGSLQSQTALLKEQQNRFLETLEKEAEAVKQAKTKAKQVQSTQTPEHIVAQIDKVLQKHVQQEPSLSDHSIHLISAANGGVQIDVNGTRYNKPKDIENRVIQKVIKQALKEWEKS